LRMRLLKRQTTRSPNVPDWMNIRVSRRRRKFLDFFITGHPMEKYKEKLGDLSALSTADICAMKKSTAKEENITTAGLISGLRVAKSRRGELWAQAALEDMSGKVEVLVFPRLIENWRRK